MGNSCTSGRSTQTRRQERSVTPQRSEVTPHHGEHPLSPGDIMVPVVERFDGDIVDSDVDDMNGSLTALPAVLLHSTQSVGSWLAEITPREEVSEPYELISPSFNVEDWDANDRKVAEAERLAPVTHYDATNERDRKVARAARIVDPLALQTPTLPTRKKASWF